MTDKKYEELLKCAAAYINEIDRESAKWCAAYCESDPLNMSFVEFEIKNNLMLHIVETSHHKALKACLTPPPPSREEIVHYLHNMLTISAQDKIMVNAAIEELRK